MKITLHSSSMIVVQASIASNILASYPGAQWGGERAPGTHRLRMRLISQISGKIVYFSNLPCYVDVIIN